MNKNIGVVIHTSLRRRLFSSEDWFRLSKTGTIRATASETPLNEGSAAEILRDCEVAVGSWNTPVPTAALVSQCPRLRLWIHAAGSVKSFFGPHLQEANVKVASCKAALAGSVAELALGEIIIGVRRILENAVENRSVQAPWPTNCRTLPECTVGVVSASETGRALISLLRPFGCRVLVWDPYLSETEAAGLGAANVDDLVRLCAESDVISLHAPSLPETKNLLNARHFQAMPDDAIFLNTARGDCIDEADLIAELRKGRLRAFLDVTCPEPAALDNPLRTLPNVVLTSHMASPPSIRIGRQVVEDIERYLNRDEPRHVVTPDLLKYVA